MKALNIINTGEQLISFVKQSKPPKNQIKQFRLNTEELQKLTKKDEALFESHKRNDYTFNQYLYSWYNWVLDLSYKMKSNCEILLISLKKDGNEVLKGAYTKTKVKNGEIKKFRLRENDYELQTGHTNAKGKVLKSEKKEFFPEKYLNYIWALQDRNLLILSDYFGLFGKRKTVEELAKEYNIKPERITYLKNKALWLTRDRMEDGLKPIKETEHGYTLKDYVQAIRHLQNNKIYDYMKGGESLSASDTIIDEKFLNEVAKIRKSQDIINEWRITRNTDK